MPQDAKTRLTADDWADEALRVVGERGLAGVAVEPIAARLGTTKGSFYWHFANRDALVGAALARWERRHTDQVIAEVDAEPDPIRRMRFLFAAVIAGATRDRIEVTLLASAGDARVAPVLRRVTERRLDYITSTLRSAGFPPDAARRRAQLSYTTYLGHVQLAHAAPDVLLADQDYVDLVMAAVTT